MTLILATLQIAAAIYGFFCILAVCFAIFGRIATSRRFRPRASWREKGGTNQPSDWPAVRPLPPGPMTSSRNGDKK